MLQTLRHILGWNLSNQKKRKTSSGLLKHITNWLAKVQDRGGNLPTHSFRFGNSLEERNQAVSEEWLENNSRIIEGTVINES